MSYLLIIRNAAGLSQSKMAVYLGVSKSLIYHVEKGLRELRSRPNLKALDLFIEIQKRNNLRLLPDTFHNIQKQRDIKLQEAVKEKNNIENHIEILKVRLERMKISNRKRSALMTTNNIVAENIRNGIFDKVDVTWLAVNEVDALQALRYSGPNRQEKMEIKIRKLQAEVMLLEEFIKVNKPQLALPMIGLKEAV